MNYFQNINIETFNRRLSNEIYLGQLQHACGLPRKEINLCVKRSTVTRQISNLENPYNHYPRDIDDPIITTNNTTSALQQYHLQSFKKFLCDTPPSKRQKIDPAEDYIIGEGTLVSNTDQYCPTNIIPRTVETYHVLSASDDGCYGYCPKLYDPTTLDFLLKHV